MDRSHFIAVFTNSRRDRQNREETPVASSMIGVRVRRLLGSVCWGLWWTMAPLSLPAAEVITEVEYAIRWNPRDGGPQTAAEVLKSLGKKPKAAVNYSVRYFDLPRPASAPEGTSVILRQRSKSGGKTQIRLKYRRPEPLTSEWECPADEFEKSSERDVTWLGQGQKTSFSYSCSLKAESPPAELAARPKPCVAQMTRYEADGWKVEEWRLAGGQTLLELSRQEQDGPAGRVRFQGLVDQLLASGVRPFDRSKTELGSECP